MIRYRPVTTEPVKPSGFFAIFARQAYWLAKIGNDGGLKCGYAEVHHRISTAANALRD
jgi:hypothetical protein